jgi:hypothetical protein
MTIFDQLETCGYKLTTELSSIYYITEEYEQAMYDVEDEGSGELNIYFQNQHVCQRVITLLKEFGKYCDQKEPLTVSILIDEDDIVPSTYCVEGCNCINCSVELQEETETNCGTECKCINCETEKLYCK